MPQERGDIGVNNLHGGSPFPRPESLMLYNNLYGVSRCVSLKNSSARAVEFRRKVKIRFGTDFFCDAHGEQYIVGTRIDNSLFVRKASFLILKRYIDRGKKKGPLHISKG